MELLARLFELIMQPCYAVAQNWWVAILLFTLITKVILLPVSLWTQKNSVLMVSLLPQLNRIKVDHFGDKEAIGEAQSALYKKEHYHPLLSLLPLGLQVLILFGLVDVIRGIVASGQPGTELLGLVPLQDGGIAWVMPVLAALSSLILGLAQNRINPLQREQGKAEQASTNGLSIALSAVLGVSVASGMVFYWICSNLMAILVQLACNAIYKPSKHVDYDALRQSQDELAVLQNLSKTDRPWYRPDPLAKRERDDIARFYDVVGKHIVFYSERSGFYKYFQGAIEWLLANSDVRIHYITNDPNDQVFAIHQEQPRLIPYYVGEKRLITLMMKMDCDVFVATLADLDNYYLKRSYVRKDIEYVFMFHHMTSTFLVGSADCHDHYDTLLCVGPHQKLETEREEQVRGLPRKRLVETGYDLLDRERAAVARRPRPVGGKPTVLIAPSWQDDCILDLCPDQTIRPLLEQGFRVIVRPHPEYTKRYAARWKALQDRFSQVPAEDLYFEQDFSSADSIFDADVLVTDWSSISCEFSFCTLRPTIFVDTPMKEGNDQWHELGLVPTDISLRNQIGESVAVDQVETIGAMASRMMAQAESWERRIQDVYQGFVYNPGRGGEAAGRYLLDAVLRHQQEGACPAGKGDDPAAGETGAPAPRPQGADAAGAEDAAGAPKAGQPEAPKAAPRQATPRQTTARQASLRQATPRKPAPRHAAPVAEREATEERRRKARHFGLDAGFVVALAAIVLLCSPAPAQAYVDPSVVTYTIQALAGVAVALSAVLGVVWRRLRRKLYKTLKIDENRHKLVEPPVHAVDGSTREGARQLVEADGATLQDLAGLGPDRPQNARWAPRFALSLLAVGTLVYGLGVAGPLETVAGASDSFPFGLAPVIAPLVTFAVLVALAGAVLLSLVRGKAFNYVLAVVMAVAVGCLVQPLYLNAGLPLADGTPVAWEDYTKITLVSSLVWICILAAFVVWARVKGPALRTASVVLCVALVTVQSVSLVQTVQSTQEALGVTANVVTGKPLVTTDGMDQVSAKDNVVVFVLDTFDNAYMDQVLERYPDALDEFTGFTRYANSSGLMIPTRYAMSSLLTGNRMDQSEEAYGTDTITRWYTQDNFIDAVRDAGYSARVYASDIPQGLVPLEGRVENIQHEEFTSEFWPCVTELWKCSLYRDLPWALKPAFWYYSGDVVNALLPLEAQSLSPFGLDDAAHLQALREDGLTIEEETVTGQGANGDFRVIHLMGSHYPFTLNDQGERVEEGSTDQIAQSRGSLRVVEQYIQELKRLGVYDDTTIVVTADHGIWYLANDITGPTSPFLLYKPAETAEEAAQPLQVSQAPVSQADIWPTLLRDMGYDDYAQWGDGVTLDQVPEDAQRTRYYVSTAVDYQNGSADYWEVKEWAINGDVQDWSAWSETGRRWTNTDSSTGGRGPQS